MKNHRQESERILRNVVLTFDDGPSIDHTPVLLDILSKQDVKAVFFVLGKRLATQEGIDIATRAVHEGHTLGNHTYSHPDLRNLNQRQVLDELSRTHDLISKCNCDCKFFRPPFGKNSTSAKKVVEDFGYQTIMWNVNTIDWKLRSGELWVDHTILKISNLPRSIVLMHDIHGSTITYMESFIQKIKNIPHSRILAFE